MEETPASLYTSPPFLVRTRYSFRPEQVHQTSNIISFKQGQLGLIHAVDASGWGYCSLLESGACGWIPTNFCAEYQSRAMKTLLKATMTFENALRPKASIKSQKTLRNVSTASIIRSIKQILVCIIVFIIFGC